MSILTRCRWEGGTKTTRGGGRHDDGDDNNGEGGWHKDGKGGWSRQDLRLRIVSERIFRLKRMKMKYLNFMSMKKHITILERGILIWKTKNLLNFTTTIK